MYEICTVYLNDKFAGSAQNTLYCFGIREYAVSGKNNLRIEVRTGIARDTDRPDQAAFGRSMSADVYNVLEPGELIGPVMLCYLLLEENVERMISRREYCVKEADALVLHSIHIARQAAG